MLASFAYPHWNGTTQRLQSLWQHFEIRNNRGARRRAAASSQQRDVHEGLPALLVGAFLSTRWDHGDSRNPCENENLETEAFSWVPGVSGRPNRMVLPKHKLFTYNPHAFCPIQVQSEHDLSVFQSNSLFFHVNKSILENSYPVISRK